MATKNPRINVTFEEKTVHLLGDLARQEQKSISSLVRELSLEALEMREDVYLSKLADTLDQPHVNTYSHDDAWK